MRPEWSWPATQSAAVRVEGGALTITPSTDEAVAAILPTAADYTAETVIPARSTAGLAAWGSRATALALTATPEGQLVLWRRQNGTTTQLAAVPTVKADKVHLRMRATGGNQFAFAWSADGRVWNDVRPSVGGEHLPPWDLAVRLALAVGGPPGAEARFDWVRIDQRATAVQAP